MSIQSTVRVASVWFGLLLFGLAGCSRPPSVSESRASSPASVELIRNAAGASLSVSGRPFRITGAGGSHSLELLAQHGGNAFRTWGVDQLEDGLLDEAHKHGLKVAVGLWLRHDLDYNDEAQVQEQIRFTLQGVRRYQNHPAVLLWGIGNEMEGDGSNLAVWKHIETIAKQVKEIDPFHPTMTVLAEIGGDKIKHLHEHCPSMDIVGVNAYGGAASIPKRYREAGGTKPYILTEFGPRGPWDLPRNAIGSVDEELGSVKAATYLESFNAARSDTVLCLGSFAFVWGQKQEATPTWFGMFLEDGRKTLCVDVMSKAWDGQAPENLCPEVKSLALVGDRTVAAGETLSATLVAEDPERDPLQVEWVLMADAREYLTGGYYQETPPTFPDNIIEKSNSDVSFRAPEKPGLYRIFAYVGDGHGSADVANVVFRVGE